MRLFITLVVSVIALSAQTIGTVHFANSGNAQAQAPFLRGLAQLHNFEYDAAEAAFKQAEAADPDFAMAYWGEALTHVHPLWNYEDLAGARGVLNRLAPTAEARAAKAKTERERQYLASVEALFFSEGDRDARNMHYAEALAALHARYPEDVDAAALYALSLLGTKALHRDYATYMHSAAVLEEYLPKFPDHPGVLHYMIHSYDDPVHALLGLRAARRYGEIAGDAPHALHMTSHIFIAAGMWPDVIAANRKAFEVSNRHAAAAGKPAPACGHGSSWQEYALLQLGKMDEAARFLQFCSERIQGRAPDSNGTNHLQLLRAYYILNSERWNDPVLQMPAPPAEFINARITYHYVSAFAAARRRDMGEAQQKFALLRAAHEELKAQQAKETHPDRSFEQRAGVLEEQITALNLIAAGKLDEGVATLKRARDLEVAIPFEFGPPFIEKPSAELLAEFELEQKRPAEAVASLRDQLTRTPARLITLRQLRTAAQALKDNDTVRWAESQIQSNLSGAETTVAATR